MRDLNILYKSYYPINDKIHVIIPTVEEVLEDESNYYGLVSAFTAMPIDMMVQLYDAGIDFSTIDEYELFQSLFLGLRGQDTHLLFGDLDLSKFEPGINPQNNNFIFYDSENDIVIDRAIHNQIATVLRQIHHLEKNIRKPGNAEALDYMIKKERKRLKRLANKPYTSQLEPLIISMVNTEQYKYDFETTKYLTIYQFNQCVLQVIRKNDYNNLMHGVYSGTVDVKEVNKNQLTWIGREQN